MRIFVVFLLFSGLVFAKSVCGNKLFNLHIKSGIKLKYILSDIVDSCKVNFVIKSEAKPYLNSDINFINLKNVHLKELLDTVLDSANLFYEIKGKKIIVSYYKTKTFKVDFIPNTISGTTNVSSKNNSMTANYNFDFWANLQTNIVQILKNIDKNYKEPIIDKNSGFVTVTGTKEQLQEIAKYIKDLNNRLHKEVLIDVKIYSVSLGKSHQTGINWAQLTASLSAQNIPIRARYVVGSETIFNTAQFSISGLLNFLSQNGTVNSISNPKIATLNNQKALISVGDTIYYKYASSVTNPGTTNPITNYTIESKFVGVSLDITPQISDNNEIVLSINPRISAFKDQTQLTNINRDMPPDTQDNTMMSVVRLKNNETLVLGGLITTDSSLRVNGVPVLKEIPVVKYLFSSKEEVTNKKELVFVITPKIIDFTKKTKLRNYGFKQLPTLEDLDVRESN